MEKFGYTWNKSKTNPAENKIIADNAIKALEDQQVPNSTLQKDDTDYINYAYPKTNDDFHNEEITNRRIIEGYDVYNKLTFETEDQNNLKKTLEEKRGTDYEKVWNEYGKLIENGFDVAAEFEHQKNKSTLHNFEVAVDQNTRFNLQKSESLTDGEKKNIENEIIELKNKIHEIDKAAKEYEINKEDYEKLHKSTTDKYESWNTDPRLN